MVTGRNAAAVACAAIECSGDGWASRAWRCAPLSCVLIALGAVVVEFGGG